MVVPVVMKPFHNTTHNRHKEGIRARERFFDTDDGSPGRIFVFGVFILPHLNNFFLIPHYDDPIVKVRNFRFKAQLVDIQTYDD